MIINYTIQQVSDTCWKWCQEEFINYQGNIEIKNISIVAFALVALVINRIIMNHWDTIIEHTKITDSQLQKLFDLSSFIAFVLLVLFLIYFLYFA